MRICTCLAVLLCAALTAGAADKPEEAKKEAERLIGLGQVSGVLTSTGGSEANLSVRVTLRSVEPNLQAQANFLKRQLEIARNPNPLERQKQLAQLLRDPPQLYSVRETQHNLEAVPADDMKVRLLVPPPAFDDKGNIKRYTARELRELKGPGNLPGYSGLLEDLRTNQIVLLYLARKPIERRPRDPDEVAAEERKNNLPIVRTIVVLGEKN